MGNFDVLKNYKEQFPIETAIGKTNILTDMNSMADIRILNKLMISLLIEKVIS